MKTKQKNIIKPTAPGITETFTKRSIPFLVERLLGQTYVSKESNDNRKYGSRRPDGTIIKLTGLNQARFVNTLDRLSIKWACERDGYIHIPSHQKTYFIGNGKPSEQNTIKIGEKHVEALEKIKTS